MVSDFVYLLLYPERTDVAGTLLLAGQVEAEILGGQPKPLSWMVGRSRGASSISEALLPPHCLLELDVIWVPHSLALPEPIIHSWNLRRLSRPREEWGMVAEHALKGSEAGGGIPEGVLSILGPWEEAAPVVLDPVAVCQELASEFLDLALSLAIRLGMVAGGQAHSDP